MIFIRFIFITVVFAVSHVWCYGNNTYTVKKFDTMWDLAEKYLGNNYQWNRIWEINQHIRDAHWIYPGDHITIPGLSNSGQIDGSSFTDGEQNVESDVSLKRRVYTPTSEVGTMNTKLSNTFLSDGVLGDALMNNLFSSLNYEATLANILDNGLIRSEIVYQAAFLWNKKDVNGLVLPGNAEIISKGNKLSSLPYSIIECNMFKINSYTIGDNIEIIHPNTYIEYKGKIANLISPVASGIVKDIRGNKMTIELLKVWDVVKTKDRIIKKRIIHNFTINGVEDATIEIEGEVILRHSETEFPQLYQIFLINRGSDAGVRTGDIFLVHHEDESVDKKNVSAFGCAVKVDDNSSSVMIVQLYKTSLGSGDKVSLVRRLLLTEK